MTDRELLELAAKAAGLPLGFGDGQYFYCEHGEIGPAMYGKRGNVFLKWSSLSDYGDALWLAVKLKIPLQFPDWNNEVRTWGPRDGDPFDEPGGNDLGAATRRAITSAAAEIGKSMP